MPGCRTGGARRKDLYKYVRNERTAGGFRCEIRCRGCDKLPLDWIFGVIARTPALALLRVGAANAGAAMLRNEARRVIFECVRSLALCAVPPPRLGSPFGNSRLNGRELSSCAGKLCRIVRADSETAGSASCAPALMGPFMFVGQCAFTLRISRSELFPGAR